MRKWLLILLLFLPINCFALTLEPDLTKWTKFCGYKEDLKGDKRTSCVSVSKENDRYKITMKTISGDESLGIPLTTETGKTYAFSFSYSLASDITPQHYHNFAGDGLVAYILPNNYDGAYTSVLTLSNVLGSFVFPTTNNSSGTQTITFTAKGSTTYLMFDSVNVQDSTTITFYISNVGVKTKQIYNHYQITDAIMNGNNPVSPNSSILANTNYTIKTLNICVKDGITTNQEWIGKSITKMSNFEYEEDAEKQCNVIIKTGNVSASDSIYYDELISKKEYFNNLDKIEDIIQKTDQEKIIDETTKKIP